MKLTFLGGADGIGASCTLVEIAGHRVLVDCGIRQSGGDPLPFLSRIDDAGGVDAILLTHAHMDHSGALPVVYPIGRDVPVYMTAPTLDIVSILLRDALKIMGSGLEREGEVPLYAEPAVERCLSAVRKVPFLTPVDLFPDDVRATFYPAGHILGAASILLESSDGTVLFSGDVALSDQLTVPGMMVPQGVRPDAVVVESTYGARQHTSRSVEEERLVEQAETVTSREGAVLFPAFAVGRAQEVLLVLQRAIAKGDLKDVPIYVDGMVRQVCGVYASHEDVVTPWLRHRISRFGSPFFHLGSNTTAVVDPRKREKIATERPAVVVSSSGMLSGGPSQFYAQRFAADPRCYIGITGYQDEESPGRALQDVARAGSGSLRLGQSVIDLACGVGTYGLSAHADASQILRILQALEPENAVFVHGDEGSRTALANAAQLHGVERSHLPGVGDEVEVRPARRRRAQRPPREPDRLRREPIDEEGLLYLAALLVERDGPHAWYTIDDLLKAWGTPGAAGDVEERNRVRALLQTEASPFVRDRKRFFMWRVRTDVTGAVSGVSVPASRPRPRQRMEESAARQHAKTLFADGSGLYQVSAFAATGTIVLAFHFPASARVRFAAEIERVAAETGWTVTVRDEPHQGALADAAVAALPEGVRAAKQPSIFREEQAVLVRVEGEPLDPAALECAAAAFRDLTGYELRVEVAKTPAGAVAPTEPIAAGKRLDQSSAQQRVRAIFPPEAGLYRVGVLSESGTLALAFHFPQTVRSRFPECFERVPAETGWTVTVREEPHLEALSEAAEAAVPEGIRSVKRPSVRHDLRSVTLRVAGSARPDAVESAVAAFRALTGYELRLEW